MKDTAGLQYIGLPGVTRACSEAVLRLLQFGDQIRQVRILSRAASHALLLTVNVEETIAVKTGFASGYGGEGPFAFSWVLALLQEHGADIEEYDVRQGVLDRLDHSSLTAEDLAKLEAAGPVRPSRWYDYILEKHWQDRHQILFQHFPPVVPYGIIDTRLMDLALRFVERPDESLLTGYRRLEDIVRTRTGVDDHGQKLFAQAFQGEKAKLTWPALSSSEAVSRASLFTAVYGAYRNPRAHREQEHDAKSSVAELLMLNHLYVLERAASENIRQGQDKV